MSAPLLSVIVLNYNGKDHYSRCLRSLIPQTASCELIFADNASTDGSFAAARDEFSLAPVRWIQNGANLGYAGGNNAAARQATGQFLLFLNNDTEVAPNAIAQLQQYLRQYPEIAGGQCAVIEDRDRTRLQAAGVDVDIFGFQYARSASQRPETVVRADPIFTGIGAALVVSAQWFSRVQGFDESYFLLCEETDLCWRIGLAGGTMRYFPMAWIYHVGSGTRVAGPAQLSLFVRNRVKTLRKNLGPTLLPIGLTGQILGMVLVALLYRLRGASDMAAATIQGLRDGLADKNVRGRRKDVQRVRVVSDLELIRNGMLKFPNFRGLLANGSHYA